MHVAILQNVLFSLQYSWFFFEVLIKSMAQHLIENSKVKVCQLLEKNVILKSICIVSSFSSHVFLLYIRRKSFIYTWL